MMSCMVECLSSMVNIDAVIIDLWDDVRHWDLQRMKTPRSNCSNVSKRMRCLNVESLHEIMEAAFLLEIGNSMQFNLNVSQFVRHWEHESTTTCNQNLGYLRCGAFIQRGKDLLVASCNPKQNIRLRMLYSCPRFPWDFVVRLHCSVNFLSSFSHRSFP
jgi:hypothetical protein